MFLNKPKLKNQPFGVKKHKNPFNPRLLSILIFNFDCQFRFSNLIVNFDFNFDFHCQFSILIFISMFNFDFQFIVEIERKWSMGDLFSFTLDKFMSKGGLTIQFLIA